MADLGIVEVAPQIVVVLPHVIGPLRNWLNALMEEDQVPLQEVLES